MNNKVKLVLYVIGVLLVTSVVLNYAKGNISVNRKIPNLYAPQYKVTINDARLSKVMPRDRDYIIKNYIMIKMTRARKINEFKLETTNGGLIDSSQFAGKVTMLYVLGIHDDVSKSELPALAQLVTKYDKEAFQAYGVVVRALPSEYADFSKSYKVPFPTAVVKGNSPIPISFVPTHLFIGKQGYVRAYIGGRKLETDVREFIIDRLLRE